MSRGISPAGEMPEKDWIGLKTKKDRRKAFEISNSGEENMSGLTSTVRARSGAAVIMTILLINLFLIPSALFGAQRTITSVPYTISTSNDTLVFSGNLTAQGNGIVISPGVHDIYIRGRGDTLIFSAGGNNSVYGIDIGTGSSNRPYNIKIDSLTIIQSSSAGDYCRGIRLNGVHDVRIYDCNVHVKGFDCIGIGHTSTTFRSYNVEIRGGNWTSFVNSFSNRCQNSAAVMQLGYGEIGAGDYNYWVHNVEIDSCPHTGILVYDKAFVDSCVLWGNAHNDNYTRPSGNVCFSADNPYMIGLGFAQPGSRATYNTIRTRDMHEGGRGIIVSAADGSAQNPVVIAYNDIRVSNGPSDDDGQRPATRGIRLREGEPGQMPFLKHVHVHDNYVEVHADTLSSTTHIGTEAAAFQGMNFYDATTDIKVYNNTFIALADTTGGFSDGWGGVYASATDGESAGTDLVSYNNHYVSNGSCIGLSAIGPNAGVGNWQFVGDTLDWRSPGFVNGYGWRGIVGVGFAGTMAVNNVVRDVVYIGYDGGLDSNAMNFSGGGTKDMLHQKTLKVYVYGNNSLPVPGSSVWAVNNYGDTVLSGTTNAQGFVAGVVNYDYDLWTGLTHFDSVFNDFTLKARMSGDSVSIAHTVTAMSSAPILVLSGTGGVDPPNDIVPPGRTVDLQALPGDQSGIVELSWSAPGDDEFIGTASYYVIKYSTGLITESNWSLVSTAPNPPTPLAAGSPQSYTVNGLTPGEEYYFAIKAYDDVDNVSPLSNVPLSFANGIAAPSYINTEIDSDNGSAMLICQSVDSYLAVFYEFHLDSIDTFTDPIVELGLVADTVVSALFGSLAEDVYYHWRCRAKASNGSDSSAWSQVVSFNMVTGISAELSSANCLYPRQGDAVQTNTPVFQVEYVTGVNNIYISVDDNAGFTSPVESGILTTSASETTNWQIQEPLIQGQTYYWRISADNTIWTSPIGFSVFLDPHPYPNPFRISNGNTEITFTNLPPQSRVVIATVSGKIVRDVQDLGPTDWVWDVRNEKGRELASGVYLYILEYPGGSSSGKIMVIR